MKVENQENNEQREFWSKAQSKFNFSSYLGINWISDNLTFILFAAVLAMVHIANNHVAIKNVKQINRLESEIKELRWEQTTAQSDLSFKSKQSEVAKMVADMDLKELSSPPIQIKTNDDE